MKQFKIVNTDNYGSDHPDEKFVDGLPCLSSKQDADKIADAINDVVFNDGRDSCRFWKVVEMPYELQTGFEP